MERPSVAVVLALAGSLMLCTAPVQAGAAEPAAQQGVTEVTVDLSGMRDDVPPPDGPLAETGDPRPGGAVALCGSGLFAGTVGYLLTRDVRRRRDIVDGGET